MEGKEMRKTYLLSYKAPKFYTLCEWVDYELSIEIVWLFGLFKTMKTTTYRVFDHENTKLFFGHWDNLIAKRLPIKLSKTEKKGR